MTTFNFYLFSNSHGERFAFYSSENGEKIIDQFSKISYTPEILFEDMENEFPAFPWNRDIPGYGLDEKWQLLGMDIVSLVNGMDNEMDLNMIFNELVCITASDEAIYQKFKVEEMNENEIHLFCDMDNYLKNYCHEHGMTFCNMEEI